MDTDMNMDMKLKLHLKESTANIDDTPNDVLSIAAQ